MRPGEMDGVKKENASDIGTPPGGPCRPALPGLSPYMDCSEREIIIPEEVYDGAHWDIRGEAPKLKKVYVIHLKKAASHE